MPSKLEMAVKALEDIGARRWDMVSTAIAREALAAIRAAPVETSAGLGGETAARFLSSAVARVETLADDAGAIVVIREASLGSPYGVAERIAKAIDAYRAGRK